MNISDLLRVAALGLVGLAIGQTILITVLAWRALSTNGGRMTRWHILGISLGLDLYAASAAVEHVLRIHRPLTWRAPLSLTAGLVTNASLFLVWRITRARYAQHKARQRL